MSKSNQNCTVNFLKRLKDCQTVRPQQKRGHPQNDQSLTSCQLKQNMIHCLPELRRSSLCSSKLQGSPPESPSTRPPLSHPLTSNTSKEQPVYCARPYTSLGVLRRSPVNSTPSTNASWLTRLPKPAAKNSV